jgi:capsid protein
MGMPGAIATTVNTATGEKFQQANVWDGGQIQSLEPGSKVKILHDARPPREQRDFTADLKRDIAQGFGLPIEVIDDMGNLNGPGIRFVMDFAGNWIRCRQKRLKTWARQIWRYVIACEIAAGRLPLPAPDAAGKQKWWAVTFTSQRLLTIDRGKESRARLDELNAGVSTLADWEEFDGRDWKDRGLQRIREVQFLKAECAANGLDYAEVFPPRPGTAAAQATADATPPSSTTEDDTEDDTEDNPTSS